MIVGVGTNKSYKRYFQSANLPAPTIMQSADGQQGQGWIEVNDEPDLIMAGEKPPYRVPLMEEIAQFPWNGYRVVSTFSGAGGSCLGFKLAGFKVLWANEFIPAAQETYRANHPDTYLDTRDIRVITGESILSQIGLRVGELDVMEGSPPCAAFSLAGKREAGWGKVKNYSDTEQRVDDLFFEYARLVKAIQPKVFVAENVGGLVRGTAKGYFKEILAALKDAGYEVKSKLLDAQWLGVPQMRQRIIFMGVRSDLGISPVFPKPLPYRYSVREAIPWAVKHSRHPSGTFTPEFVPSDRSPAGAILASSSDNLGLIEAETDISRFAIGDEWERIAPGQRSKKYVQLYKQDLDKPSMTIVQTSGNPSAAGPVMPTEKRKFTIAELKRICSFPDDFILTGNFSQQWERMGRAVPPVMMSHVAAVIRDQILAKVSS